LVQLAARRDPLAWFCPSTRQRFNLNNDPMYDLQQPSLRQMTEYGAALRGLAGSGTSMEAVSTRMVRMLFDEVVADGVRACVLVRAYTTQPLGVLEPELQRVARQGDGRDANDRTKCLTLLASAGSEREWNSRHDSRRHRAIPLSSAEAVERLPMVARLVGQLGLDVDSLLAADDRVIMDLQQRTFNVFYVPEAAGSPHIPDQAEFVMKYGVRSVLGFGSVLPSGELFAVILFSRAQIPPETAQQFQPLALAAKLAVLPYTAGPIFEAAV
jgi:two-component system, NtrC family, sensor kinase